MVESLPTFDDLRFQGGTGRAILLSGTGRDKKYGYRRGVYCKLGDIEQSEWMRLMRELIERSHEEQLHRQLLCWHKEHSYLKETSEQIAFSVLVKHSMRLFDDPNWVDYIKFNQRYRPEILADVAVAKVRSACCSETFLTTQALLGNSFNGTTCCQICGRWSEYEIISTDGYTNLNTSPWKSDDIRAERKTA